MAKRHEFPDAAWKTRLPKDYLNPAKNFQAGEKTLTAEELPFEFLMNAGGLILASNSALGSGTLNAANGTTLDASTALSLNNAEIGRASCRERV